MELDTKLKRLFYCPIILLKALLETNQFPRRNPAEEARSGATYEPEHVFRDFVNRLALICQTEPGGDTVSSCAVLQEPDRVLYVFASNHRTELQLRTMSQRIGGILGRLRVQSSDDPSASEDEAGDDGLRGEILDEVLLFNRRRVKAYLTSLEKALALCIKDCGAAMEQSDRALGSRLSGIADLVLTALAWAVPVRGLPDEEDQYPAAIKAVTAAISSLHQSHTLFGNIRRRIIRGDRAGKPNSFYDFCHITDRLRAYHTAVDSLFDARQTWPELFDDGFDVCFISSPDRGSRPCAGPPKKATQLVRMITSKAPLMAKYEAQAADLQAKHGFDEIIKQEWTRPHRTTVHAEMQILGWLESSEGRTRPERFFGGYRYIGSSKPTCRLCSYFFDEHPSGVKVRPSHANLYPAWRPYDVSVENGEHREHGSSGAVSLREVMHRVKKRIVDDIARALDEKFVDGRYNDSTDLVGKRLGGSAGTGSLLDSLSSKMGGLSIAGDAGRDGDDASSVVYSGREAPRTTHEPPMGSGVRVRRLFRSDV